jgi:signal transduction histidine kinase
MPRATGYPAYRELVRRVSDVLAVLLAAASAVNSAYRFSAHPDLALVIVLALTAVPLYVRRTWPVPVFGIILAACIGTAIWGSYRTIDGLALLFALYTVAALRPLRQALACAGVLAAGIVGIAVAVGGSSWWYDAILVCGLYGAGLGLGLYSGTRRAYLAELTDRAARLERERDQQGELAAAAERARIAREMHDIVAHNLTVMVTLSEAATAAAASSPGCRAQKSNAAHRLSCSLAMRANVSGCLPSQAPASRASRQIQSKCRLAVVSVSPASFSRSRPYWRMVSRSQ